MNKRDFKIWKEGVEIAMFIVGQHIRCPMVEDKVREEIERQARIAEETEKKDLAIAEEFDKLFSNPELKPDKRNKVLGVKSIGAIHPCKKCGKPGAVLYFPGGYMCENGCESNFGWEEPAKGVSTKKDNGWQSKFKKTFENGPVNRRPRK